MRDVAHQLDVLALVVADRDLVGAAGQHVGGHQHGVEVQAGGDKLTLLRRLVLELRHPVEIPCAVTLDRSQVSSVARARRTAETGCGAQATAPRPSAWRRYARVDSRSSTGSYGHRERVQVDDAEEPLTAILVIDPAPDRADVVAEVLLRPSAGCR